jgi:hypothetical protein
MENKNSFFSLSLNLDLIQGNAFKLENLLNSVDLVLSSMGVKTKSYQFKSTYGNELVYLFQTDTRKRKGQLAKYCDQHLPQDQSYQILALTKTTFESELLRFQNNLKFNLVDKPTIFDEYAGTDIKIFDNKANWHEWQLKIYEKIFNPDGSFKQADPRKIISLVDQKGNSGKSSFFKWLFYKNPDTIGRIGYGSASQLRSSAVNLGKKDLYVVDLARSKSKDDRQEDLLSVLEDLKSGLVTNVMYGSGKTLIMEPPHIIVSSNYILKYDLLSEDRWDIYQITSSNKLKQINLKPKAHSLLKQN